MSYKTLLVSFLIALAISMTKGVHAQESFCFMELNAENFFDPIDDMDKSDDDFLPGAPRAWSWKKFWKKTNNLTKVIAAAGNIAPPDVIALCEVENDTVLTYLTKISTLRRVGYEYLITQGDDIRGMNVAFIYNPQTFKVLCHEGIRPDFSGLPDKKTRDVLYVNGMVLTGDTVDVFVCHLPSKLDRRKEGREYRMRIALQIRAKIDSIMAVRENANVIVTGDFNDTPDDKVLLHGFKAENIYGNIDNPKKNGLYNLMFGKTANHGVKGTYCYKGEWELLDNFIVNGRLIDDKSRFYTSYSQCSIFAPDFLLTEIDGRFEPLRTYKGYKYVGGFSDHLPVVVRFNYSW